MKRQFQLSIVSLVLAVVTCVVATAQNADVANRVRTHITYLAGEQLAGRYPGTEGNKLAADYIAAEFQRNGLKPLGTSYFQEFPIPVGVSLTGDNMAQFELIIPKVGIPNDQLKPVKIGWKPGIDYTPLGFSESKSLSGLPIVFCGFGTTDSAKNYDDYAGVDVKGKVVIVLSGDRENYNLHGKFKVDNAVRMRTINARQHGAVAVIFVHPQGDSSDVLMPLRVDSKANISGIMVFHVKRSIITKIFPRERPIITEEEKIMKSKQPSSFEFPNIKANLSVGLKTEETTIANVIGVVPGTDAQLSKEYIVVGAHYDHLGWGDEHSLYEGNERKIHFGADDNASGTAGMLELTSIIAKNPLPRPVIFMAFNAEERGLLGSAYYVKNPVSTLDDVVCMVNLDMIGRLKDNKLNAQGVGTSSKWKELLDSVNKQYNFAISTTEDGLGASDHSSFYTKDKPVLFFFTGLHTDYHRPTDTPDKINYEGESKVIQFTESVLRMIGAMPTKPDFVKVKTTQSASAVSKVTLGVIPDYSDHPKGLHITGVREGSPAEKGGLKGDDVIIKMGDIPIKGIYDLMYCLGKFNPGDKVTIVVLRGPKEDKEVALPVVLEGKK